MAYSSTNTQDPQITNAAISHEAATINYSVRAGRNWGTISGHQEPSLQHYYLWEVDTVSRNRNKSTFLAFIRITNQKQSRMWAQSHQTPSGCSSSLHWTQNTFECIFWLQSLCLPSYLEPVKATGHCVVGRTEGGVGKGKSPWPSPASIWSMSLADWVKSFDIVDWRSAYTETVCRNTLPKNATS